MSYVRAAPKPSVQGMEDLTTQYGLAEADEFEKAIRLENVGENSTWTSRQWHGKYALKRMELGR